MSRMDELGIDKGGESVCFGQLLGMCDHVSLTLGEHSHCSIYLSSPFIGIEFAVDRKHSVGVLYCQKD